MVEALDVIKVVVNMKIPIKIWWCDQNKQNVDEETTLITLYLRAEQRTSFSSHKHYAPNFRWEFLIYSFFMYVLMLCPRYWSLCSSLPFGKFIALQIFFFLRLIHFCYLVKNKVIGVNIKKTFPHSPMTALKCKSHFNY